MEMPSNASNIQPCGSHLMALKLQAMKVVVRQAFPDFEATSYGKVEKSKEATEAARFN